MKIKKQIFKKNRYIYFGTTHNGQKISGEIEAVSNNLAAIHLKQKGINVFTIRKQRFLLLKKFSKKISPTEITFFFRQLATLLDADIPLVQAFSILQKIQKKTEFYRVIGKIKTEIESGTGLSVGLKKFPLYFDNLSCQLIKIGEHTGALATILNRVANNKENSLKLKNKIRQALFYPMTVLSIAVMVTLVMLVSVIPRFSELFTSLNGKLPAFTLAVIQFSELVRRYGFLFLILIPCGFIFNYYINYSMTVKNKIDNLLLKLPVVKKIILVRIARSLSITFSTGIPITDALKMIIPVSGNTVYAKAISQLYFDISRGEQLHKAMQKTETLFPSMLIQMVKIGEDSGAMAAMLEKSADIYESDIDYLFTTLGHVLEPLIILVLGVLIGGLVIAMYLPIFKLGTVI